MTRRPFEWQKLGQVYQPPRDVSWRHAYGQAPCVIALADRFRVFFTVRPPRDAQGNYTSHISWVDTARDDPTAVQAIGNAPVLSPGRPGTFDSHGTMPACAIWAGDRVLLYYCGWLQLVGVPYAVSIGLAESIDGGQTFHRIGEGPILSRTPAEPFQENSPYVLHFQDRWHMWYGSGTDWLSDQGHMEAVYVTKYAWSADAVTWHRDGQPILPTHVEHECQARAMVVPFGKRWAMWFSYRHGLGFRGRERGYRIGFAWSDDLKSWNRDDALGGIDVSDTGWDSEMVCYPVVFRAGDDFFMYYNGNGFGENGFGCARLVSAPQEF